MNSVLAILCAGGVVYAVVCGNSGELSLIGPDPEYQKLFEAQHGGRGQSDIIFFATAVPEGERQ